MRPISLLFVPPAFGLGSAAPYLPVLPHDCTTALGVTMHPRVHRAIKNGLAKVTRIEYRGWYRSQSDREWFMESYGGVKFHHRHLAAAFDSDQRLAQLNHWAHLFAQLGLAPLHGSGAYGNFSYRDGDTSFVISRSAMTPSATVDPADFCRVVGFDERHSLFLVEGTAIPSSESFLHHGLYQALPQVKAILHGHYPLLQRYAAKMAIPVTDRFYPYGTRELAESALRLVDRSIPFFLLKDHGFVALGKDLDHAGEVTLSYLADLIAIIRGR